MKTSGFKGTASLGRRTVTSGIVHYEDQACSLSFLCSPAPHGRDHLAGGKTKASKRGGLELSHGWPDVRDPFPTLLTTIQSGLLRRGGNKVSVLSQA